MKKLFTLLLFGCSAILSKAQSVTLYNTQQACNNDGIITATFSGLTPPYTVTWNMVGEPVIVHTGVTGTSDMITNYTGADMYVVVTDANNIFATDQISAPPFTYNVTTSPAACPSLGTATATVTGGLPPYTFDWKDNTNTTVSTTNPASLPGGGYDVTITDANGCVFGSQQTQDSILVDDVPAFAVTMASTTANCTNGTASVANISGGTAPYTYLWNNSATTTSINGLTWGSYSVVVTDAQGCDVTAYAYVQQSVFIGANITPTPATCTQNDGAAIVFGSGGVPPYTYLWSNTATTQSLTGLSAGSLSVTVTDANGCTGSGYTNINATTPINVTYNTTASSCTSPTGSATLSITNGTPPYTTVWNTIPVQTGVTATGLMAGNYSFTVTDAVGCIFTGSAQINPVNIVTGSFNITNPTCIASNGALTANPAGGTAPYTYSWSNSATTQSITGIPGGYYGVTVTDAVGCVKTMWHNLQSTTPISLGAATTPASCIFNSDGSILAVPTGGTAPYTYSWSNGGNTQTITGLVKGYYTVNVTDANGCTKNNTTYVSYNPNNNSCYCTIEGTVYEDLNNNCTQDVGEQGINHIQMHLNGVGYTYTDANGYYSFKAPTGSYTLSETVQSFYPLATCQNNNISVSATAGTNCVQTYDFANTVNPIHSMHISSWHFGPPVPGDVYHLNTIITNEGTVTEPNIIAGFKSDGQIMAPSFVPSGIYSGGLNDHYGITGGTLSLVPGASQSILKDYTIPTNIALGTNLTFKDSTTYTGPMNNWLTDYSPWNNVNYYQPVVVSSYDPNFKEVSPKGAGTSGTIFPQDSVLEYMVHFQNLGTWQANDVVVVDTIDTDLDLSTLRPIYSSHPCTITMTESGIVTFTFSNINLPAAMYNEPGSHGMLTYTIETKPNLPMGTQFTNSAAIYFDYNAPIITNTTLNTLGWPTNVNNTTEAGKNNLFAIYPNPANNMFYAMINSERDSKAELSVVDVSGKVVSNKAIIIQKGNQSIPVDVTALSPGIYFVTLNNGGYVQTQKLVIMQ